MKKNMGRNDRLLRVLIVTVILVLYFTDVVGGTLGTVLLALSGASLLTALLGFCPLYVPFGFSTCRKA
ncbi:MAG: DUF2892 domain-containing protein [Chitinophagia bacterium]|nr:DUF2892 domain-containing protein [Chitinophagia bacterium]